MDIKKFITESCEVLDQKINKRFINLISFAISFAIENEKRKTRICLYGVLIVIFLLCGILIAVIIISIFACIYELLKWEVSIYKEAKVMRNSDPEINKDRLSTFLTASIVTFVIFLVVLAMILCTHIYSDRCSLDAGFEEELNNCTISEKLIKELENKVFSLSDNAIVMKEEKNKWRIIDEKEIYIIKKENGELNIYKCMIPLFLLLKCNPYESWTSIKSDNSTLSLRLDIVFFLVTLATVISSLEFYSFDVAGQKIKNHKPHCRKL